MKIKLIFLIFETISGSLKVFEILENSVDERYVKKINVSDWSNFGIRFRTPRMKRKRSHKQHIMSLRRGPYYLNYSSKWLFCKRKVVLNNFKFEYMMPWKSSNEVRFELCLLIKNVNLTLLAKMQVSGRSERKCSYHYLKIRFNKERSNLL